MVVKEIKINKNKVTIKCSDNTITNISIETYLNSSILVNEQITKKELQLLLNKDEIEVIKTGLIKKIIKKRMSKKEVKDYLSSCNLKSEIVDQIVNEFVNNYLIDDKELAESIISLALVNKKGINYIKDILFSRGVSGDYDSYINEFVDKDKYINNIKYLVDKYNKLGKNKSGKILKDYIKMHLINNGYNYDEFESLILINPKDDNSIVKQEVIKFFKCREKNEKNVSKITKKLISKGFNYDIIKRVIKECVKNEIN